MRPQPFAERVPGRAVLKLSVLVTELVEALVLDAVDGGANSLVALVELEDQLYGPHRGRVIVAGRCSLGA